MEACIARNLIDTSVYFWPGYAPASVSESHSSPCQRSPWSTFMDGAPLTDNLVNALIRNPASRYFVQHFFGKNTDEVLLFQLEGSEIL